MVYYIIQYWHEVIQYKHSVLDIQKWDFMPEWQTQLSITHLRQSTSTPTPYCVGHVWRGQTLVLWYKTQICQFTNKQIKLITSISNYIIFIQGIFNATAHVSTALPLWKALYSLQLSLTIFCYLLIVKILILGSELLSVCLH